MEAQQSFGGLSDAYVYHELELDSYDTTDSNNVDYASTDWPLFRLSSPIKNVVGIKVLEVQIPFSYYVFNSSNNTFTLFESTGSLSATVTIPPGNYTSASFPAYLAAALNLASLSMNTQTYTVTISSTTGKLTIATATGAPTYFTLTFGTSTDTGAKNPRLYIGFDAGSKTSSSSTTPTLEAPNYINITGSNYLYVESLALGADISLSLPAGAIGQGAGVHGPQLAKVPVSVQPGSTIFWSDPDPEKYFYLQRDQLDKLDFSLSVGNSGYPEATRLNGLNFSLKVAILTRTDVSKTRNVIQGLGDVTTFKRVRQ